MHQFNETFVLFLQKVIRLGVRVLAIFMTFVILWGVADVGYLIFQELLTEPVLLLNVKDILGIFGAFMSILIAIEIFENITLYLQDEVIHVKIVMATALMAVARKIIILDFTSVPNQDLVGLAGIVFALSIGYWLIIEQKPKTRKAKIQGLKRFFGISH